VLVGYLDYRAITREALGV